MNADDGRELSLREYVRVLGRRKWLIAAALLATLVGALGTSALQSPIYEGEAQMLVLTRASDTIFDNLTQTFADPVRAIQNEIQVLEGEVVARHVQNELGLADLPPDAVGTTIGATDVVSVVVRSGDAATAQALADAYVRAYITVKREQAVDGLVTAGTELQKQVTDLQEQIDALDQQIADAPAEQQAALNDSLAAQRRLLVDQQALFAQRLDQLQVDAALATGGAQVVRNAELPDRPVEPALVRTALLALVLGLLLGLLAAFLTDHFDDSVNTADELERATGGVPILAVVPVDPASDDRPVALSRPGDVAVEAYRRLRTNVQFLGIDAPLRVVQVTSPLAGEGKSTTAANLAVVFAQAGLRTLIVDADLRRPRLHLLFAVDDGPGLTSAIMGEPVSSIARNVGDGLDVLTSGVLPANPSEVLGSPVMRSLLARVADDYDMIVIDSAPVLPVTDSVALSAAVDGVILVTQAGQTSAKHIKAAVRQLQQVKAPVLGTVLNRVSHRSTAAGGYGYGEYGGQVSTEPQPSATPRPRIGRRSG